MEHSVDNKQNVKLQLLAIFLTIVLAILLSSSSVEAAITGYVAKGSDGKHYEYDFDALLKSYAKQLLGYPSPLFSDYMKKTMCAILDDKNGYVDFDDVVKAYAKALLNNKSFDPNEYCSSSQAKKAVMPAEVYVVTLESDGKLKYTKKIVETVGDLLDAVNGAKSAADLEALITSKAPEMGLDLTAFNKLNSYGQGVALEELLANRPGEGFDSLAQVKSAFDTAVAAAQAALEAAFKAVNEAAGAGAMKNVINEKNNILELGLSRYSLSAAELDALAAHLLQQKPFASILELQRLLHIGVISVRSGYPIHHTRYDYTLDWMVDRQMAVGPKTDLYGGGWQDAQRSDVQYYLDPYNFIDMNYDGSSADSIRVTEDYVRLRQRPTTASPQLVDETGANIYVWKNQVYAILGKEQAEPGTAPGTEGTWYKVRVSGKEGWFCGLYAEEIGNTFSATSMFQFLLLSGSAGSTVADLDIILAGKGILDGRGATFMEASRNNNINEIFLVSLALHETGNGTSELARGIDFPDEDDLFPGQETVKVYNMFGIGAYDSNPNYYGAQRAYKERWFTPQAAILGGAKFASEQYVNNPSHLQNTLYKMRWNPNNPGTHQYATDIGWAAKQVSRIRNLYNLITTYTLAFDIPRYKE